MISYFSNLIGSFGNTWHDLLLFMFCSILCIFTVTSFLQFICSLFKKD